jgi:1,2-diacylglycerol 3-alpha-glucosyltransferase
LKHKVAIVCTGLGRVRRGFETYIETLTTHLTQHTELRQALHLYYGGTLANMAVKQHKVHSISSANIMLVKWFGRNRAFKIEQFTFFCLLFPRLLWLRPRCIYLGEYLQYCYLFKARKWLGLGYGLALYTGGQVFPGLLNHQFDYIHHVTNVYLPNAEAVGFPKHRQFLIPHFVSQSPLCNPNAVADIKQAAAGRLVVLSVGLLDRQVKRMHHLVASLAPVAEHVYPILLGQMSEESAEIAHQLEATFGKARYVMSKVPAAELVNYYAAADVFVLCSLRESFGLVYLEALQHNLPVLCHDFEEARFVLGPFGHYINMQSPTALTAQIVEFLNNSERKRPVGGAAYVAGRYSWEALKPAYISMFHQFQTTATSAS